MELWETCLLSAMFVFEFISSECRTFTGVRESKSLVWVSVWGRMVRGELSQWKRFIVASLLKVSPEVRSRLLYCAVNK